MTLKNDGWLGIKSDAGERSGPAVIWTDTQHCSLAGLIGCDWLLLATIGGH